ncbi:glycoside hydrolase family 127 protein [Leifsonia sp. NPDC056665]|uniref:glycoside hydrolase family 127 protein n=1 Tax=Leifsonia sp. NPDC056665 TaxID=3345901 RepID=UPI0036A5D554
MAIEQATRREAVSAVIPSRGRLAPVGASEVEITDGFWADRQAVNAATTIDHCLRWMERLGWIANFDRTAAAEGPDRDGREFADSEIYKLLEAMAWELGRAHDDELERTYDALVARVAAAQQPDGYLNTRFGSPGQPARYSDLEWGHELYCAGHLIQAAVARLRTGRPDALVEAALRVADHVYKEFGPDGRQAVDGHPVIEPALVELARATGEPRYLELAKLFVDRRGHGTLDGGEIGLAYFSDDVPVRDSEVLRGHAVRALYLAAGAVDVAIESGDDGLLDAVKTQWDTTVARRTYLTGGMGSRHEGESFGDDFELPSDRAYSETCAGVGSVMLSWRLLLSEGDAKYADLIERTLFNVIATGPDTRGDAFFYVNPLERTVLGVEADPDHPSERAASSQRASWFAVSCCPTNIARTIASLSAYVATVDESGLQLHQFASARIRTALPGGQTVAVTVATGYPYDGTVEVVVDEAPEHEWTLSFRVPSWAQGSATVDATDATTMIEDGYARVSGALRAGSRITLRLPVEPRVTVPDARIDATRGSIAIESGPLVYAAETLADDPVQLERVRVGHDAAPVRGTDTITLPVALDTRPDHTWPYGPVTVDRPEPAGQTELQLIPYHRWAERGPSRMRVWLPLA